MTSEEQLEIGIPEPLWNSTPRAASAPAHGAPFLVCRMLWSPRRASNSQLEKKILVSNRHGSRQGVQHGPEGHSDGEGQEEPRSEEGGREVRGPRKPSQNWETLDLSRATMDF